jgi:predicted transcriptional regulator
MKTAISIPDRIFRSAEQLAARLRVSRSQLYTRALATLVERHRDDLVTGHLNEIYGRDEVDSTLDHGLTSAQQRSLGREKW